MQSKLYNCSEIGQRIIQLYMYSELHSFMFTIERNYANFAIAYKYNFFDLLYVKVAINKSL